MCPRANLFGDETYQVQMESVNPDQIQEWKDMGLNVKEKDNKSVVYLSSKAKDSTGKALRPPRVVDSQKQPWDFSKKIGNGSIANIIISLRSFQQGPKTLNAAYINALQVVDLVEYKSDSVDFDVVGNGSDPSVPFDDSVAF